MKGKENKPHIGIYGRRNNGKSSLINRLAGQDIAIVSDIAGTTTDPVKRSFEITGFGPVILIDTAGIDDLGELGEKRIQKTLHSIQQIDLAILVITANQIEKHELFLLDEFHKKEIPFIIVHNKSDVLPATLDFKTEIQQKYNISPIDFSALTQNDIEPIIETIKKAIPESSWKTPVLVGDLIKQGDLVLLITPIDVEAPEGRLILPQVNVIRDVLDNDAICVVLKEKEVDAFLRKNSIKPALVITDSQIFLKADAMIPKDIPLTGFSVILARHRGPFDAYLQGTPHLAKLQDNDRVLILESCSHHVSCEDIGRHKIPRWLSNFTGKNLEFEIVAGLDALPRPIKEYAIVIQCGGCVITRRQIFNRLKPAIDAGIPVTNYGMAIAFVQGIYNRAIEPFVTVKNETNDYL